LECQPPDGERFTITVWGKPVADLVPKRADATEVVAATVAALQAFPRLWRRQHAAAVIGVPLFAESGS
jgi:antitoxin (DNA-binding transcriptional repressor) of toxin-antitoxin stability system